MFFFIADTPLVSRHAIIAFSPIILIIASSWYFHAIIFAIFAVFIDDYLFSISRHIFAIIRWILFSPLRHWCHYWHFHWHYTPRRRLSRSPVTDAITLRAIDTIDIFDTLLPVSWDLAFGWQPYHYDITDTPFIINVEAQHHLRQATAFCIFPSQLPDRQRYAFADWYFTFLLRFQISPITLSSMPTFFRLLFFIDFFDYYRFVTTTFSPSIFAMPHFAAIISPFFRHFFLRQSWLPHAIFAFIEGCAISLLLLSDTPYCYERDYSAPLPL